MKSGQYIKIQAISGMIFRFGERILAQLVSTVVTILLARILLPEDYGIVSLTTIVITLCNVLVTDGLSSSLIQKKDSDSLDFSTIFWVSLVLSFALYGAVYVCAPMIAAYYNQPMVIAILRVMGLRVPLAAINSVQSAYVSKHMMFKKFFWATLAGTLISGVIGIYLAYHGAGAWALVVQYLAKTIIDTGVLWFIVRWRPKFEFSVKRFRDLFSFGWKVLVSGLIGEFYEELRSLIIAKRYTATDLSYYTKARHFPKLLGNNVSTTITLVMFPAFSQYQDDISLLKKAVRRTMSVSAYILFPIMLGFAAIADSFVRLVLTEKWLPCVPFIYVFSVMFLLKPLKNINKSVMKALKRSDLDLYVNVFEKVIGIVLIFVFMNHGTLWLALSALVTYLIAAVVNSIVCGHLIQYSFGEQMKDILPHLLYSLIACLPAFLLNALSVHLVIKVLLQILSAVVLYVGMSALFRTEAFLYVITYIKKKKVKPS